MSNKEYHKIWYSKNRLKKLAQNALWKINNPERRKVHAKKQYRKNKAKLNRCAAEWAKNNPDRKRKIWMDYYERNKSIVKSRMLHRNHVRRCGAESDPMVEKLILEWKSSADFTCTYCGVLFPVSALEIDHIIPISKGGRHTTENIGDYPLTPRSC